MDNLTNRMTPKEAQCYRLIKSWERKNHLRILSKACFPDLPYYNEMHDTSIFAKAIYFIILIALTPILIPFTLIRLILILLALPYNLLSTYTIPRNLQAPGERNIQGLFHAFSQFMNLPQDYQFFCINDWVKVMYGEDTYKQHNMFRYIQDERQAHQYNEAIPKEGYEGHVASNAREMLSRQLGNYGENPDVNTHNARSKPAT